MEQIRTITDPLVRHGGHLDDVTPAQPLGERDTAREPHREPTAYERSADITLFVCDQMAHMHNFASTRVKLWDRLIGWRKGLQ
jgi:hypothetical protein